MEKGTNAREEEDGDDDDDGLVVVVCAWTVWLCVQRRKQRRESMVVVVVGVCVMEWNVAVEERHACMRKARRPLWEKSMCVSVCLYPKMCLCVCVFECGISVCFDDDSVKWRGKEEPTTVIG